MFSRLIALRFLTGPCGLFGFNVGASTAVPTLMVSLCVSNIECNTFSSFMLVTYFIHSAGTPSSPVARLLFNLLIASLTSFILILFLSGLGFPINCSIVFSFSVFFSKKLFLFPSSTSWKRGQIGPCFLALKMPFEGSPVFSG